MFARYNLEMKGFVVLYRAVPEDVADHLRSLSREKTTLWINDTWDGVKQDDQRLKAFVPKGTSRSLSVDLKRVYKSFFPHCFMTTWRFPKTVAGAPDQPARRAFSLPDDVGQETIPPPGHQEPRNLPGMMFIDTQNDTVFYGYRRNEHVAMRAARRTIEFDKGDVLMVRGDFVFSSVGYDNNNVVVHGYIDPPQFARPKYQIPAMVAVKNDFTPVDDVFCFVWQCPYRATDAESLRRHLNRYHHFYFKRPSITYE